MYLILIQAYFSGTEVVCFLQVCKTARTAGKKHLVLMCLLNELLKYICFFACC